MTMHTLREIPVLMQGSQPSSSNQSSKVVGRSAKECCDSEGFCCNCDVTGFLAGLCVSSGAVDKYAGWHKASHPIQRLQRLLDLFALHSTTLHTSL